MDGRITYVNHTDILSLSTSSVFEIGDSEKVAPKSKAIAIQREKAIFFGDELSFNDYPMFRMKIPQPIVNEELLITTQNISPFIHVQNIRVRNIAASSIVHLGSTEAIVSENRGKNIRHLLREKDK